MNIKGEFRDVLTRDGKIVDDKGWRNNTIVMDYGKFLAALMKKDFSEEVGIEYMAVGSGSGNDAEAFKNKIKLFFSSGDPSKPYQPPAKDYWVWAKKIDINDIEYLDEAGNKSNAITSKLRLVVTFEEKKPSEETLIFKEFALLGIDSAHNTDKMFLVNYVDHGQITKNKDMKLTRTIRLSFPIQQK